MKQQYNQQSYQFEIYHFRENITKTNKTLKNSHNLQAGADIPQDSLLSCKNSNDHPETLQTLCSPWFQSCKCKICTAAYSHIVFGILYHPNQDNCSMVVQTYNPLGWFQCTTHFELVQMILKHNKFKNYSPPKNYLNSHHSQEGMKFATQISPLLNCCKVSTCLLLLGNLGLAKH